MRGRYPLRPTPPGCRELNEKINYHNTMIKDEEEQDLQEELETLEKETSPPSRLRISARILLPSASLGCNIG